MLKRRIELPPAHIYPPDEWRIVEARWPEELLPRTETNFALSNGFVGVRGTHEEGRPALFPGTFINGFYETWPIQHAEVAYGLATTGQTIVNVPDTSTLELFVDDEPLHLPVANLRQYRRVLDMRAGTLTRDLRWSTPSGKHIRIRSSRLVSFEHRHVVASCYEVTAEDDRAPVVLASRVVNRQDGEQGRTADHRWDPRVAPALGHRVLHVRVARREGSRLEFGYETANSRLALGVTVEHVVDGPPGWTCEATVDLDEGGGEMIIAAELRPGERLRVVKYAAYHTSRSAEPGELLARGRRSVERVSRIGYEGLLAAQRQHLDQFWARADVEVDGDPNPVGLQQAVRWNLFQLAQASWRAEGAGIPAKGLTGQAYEGHYFWDSEIYILPFLTYTQPRIARNLLRFRSSMLDKARKRAEVMNQRGALFPWRTINGEEASGNYQSGTAQYHIDADIAYAVQKYVDVRDDIGFLVEVGAEMLVETARLWADLGFHGEDGRFHIHSVTGPDEYTTVVNDNTYTNLMARRNLRMAVAAVRRLDRERPEDARALWHDTKLRPEELDEWERAAEAMFVPFEPERGIHPQDDSFLERELWDLDATPAEHFPLLLHYHPLVIYRYQVVKQADVVLAMFLLGDEFTAEQKRRNFEYYDPMTTGDSSLSTSVQSIMAAETDHLRRAQAYFEYALLIDLADVAGNVSDGVHIAACGGAWMALVYGFGGLRDFDATLSFDPHLPEAWRSLAFRLRYRGRQLRVELSHERERFLLEDGSPLEVTVRGERHVLDGVLELEPRPG